MKKKEMKELLNGNTIAILVDDKIEGATYIPWHSLLPYQGDLKEITKENEKKMLSSLIEKGFFDIKKVWRKSQNEIYILDGHQTINTLLSIRPEIESGQIKLLNKSDNKPTELIPCVFINAENEKDLSEKLLLINSEYGTITQQGLSSFVERHGISDAFMGVTVLKEWTIINKEWQQPIAKDWGPVNTTLDVETDVNLQDHPEVPMHSQNPYEDNHNQDKKDLPSENYVEYPIMFKKEDYNYFVSLVKRVKTEQLFEKNSEAIIHIARQYDTYVGSI